MQEEEDLKTKCFEASFLFALEKREALIVHGWIKKEGSEKPCYVRYAWNELKGCVYDITQHEWPMSKELFYRKHTIAEKGTRVYTLGEAAVMAVGTSSYGPWDKELLDKEELSHEEFVERFWED